MNNKLTNLKAKVKTINNGELRVSDVSKEVTLYGWVHNIRKLKALSFVDLRDRWGITQLVFKTDKIDFTKESVLQVSGIVKARKVANPELKTGEIEVAVDSYHVLSHAENLPFEIDDRVATSEELRLTYRYLDLRRQSLQNNLILRHNFIKLSRDYLSAQDFLEIETPLLGRTTPEGARDFLVPTRKNGMFFALPQSPQLYKQLLMASGIERYFQVARALRDEDLRKDRQYEFTQLDIEKSFTSAEDIMSLIEKLLANTLPQLGFEIRAPFPRMDYDRALLSYGSDKPDTRFECLISDLPGFAIKSSSKVAKRLVIKEVLTEEQIKYLTEVTLKNGASQLLWGSKASKKSAGPLYEVKPLTFKDDLVSGTMLVVVDELPVVLKALGALRVELNVIFNYADSNALNFLWIENWPLFEIDNSVIKAAHHPFTAPDASTPDFDKHPEKARAQAYDLVLNGYEVAGGSVRINDTSIQRRMFNTIGLSLEEANAKFGFFLEAFKFGLPPHAGIAFGLDRLIMVLAKASSIRDVIAFPKNAHGNALMEGAPSFVGADQLEQYHLKIKK